MSEAQRLEVVPASSRRWVLSILTTHPQGVHKMPKYNIDIILTTNHPITQVDLNKYIVFALREECKYYPKKHMFTDLVKTSRVISLKKRPMRRTKPHNVVSLVKRSHK